MRRLILVASSVAALAAAVVAGPLGAASAPYVYGCTPATYYAEASYGAFVAIYNGSATTSNFILKVLAGDGTIVQSSPTTLPATKTTLVAYIVPIRAIPGPGDSTIPASVRLVSNVPLAVTLTHTISGVHLPIYCSPLLP